MVRPDRTTAAYGDWVLRCERSDIGERGCEVAQTVLDAQSQPIAQLIARRGAQPSQITLSVQVAANATVSEPARMAAGEQPARTLPFRRCMPRGCFAEMTQAQGELVSLAAAAETAKLEYRSADGNAVSVPISLRGLAASLEALGRAEPQ